MQSLQELWNFMLGQERCVVFGNLSRSPDLLLNPSVQIPLLRIVVVVPHPHQFSSKEKRFHVQGPAATVDRCDVVLYWEPTLHQRIDKPPLATHAVVLTCHYAFKLVDPEKWVDVSYFQDPDPNGTRDLLTRREFPVYTEDVGLLEAEREPSLKIWGKDHPPPPHPHTYGIVDLTRFQHDPLILYLAFWDAFEYLLRHQSRVDRWIPCFSEKGYRVFQRFTQQVIDALFCRTFAHGNVREHRQLLALLPFYQSGTLDPTYEVTLSSFGGIPFVAPRTLEQACQVATRYDVLPIARNVLWIRSP